MKPFLNDDALAAIFYDQDITECVQHADTRSTIQRTVPQGRNSQQRQRLYAFLYFCFSDTIVHLSWISSIVIFKTVKRIFVAI